MSKLAESTPKLAPRTQSAQIFDLVDSAPQLGAPSPQIGRIVAQSRARASRGGDAWVGPYPRVVERGCGSDAGGGGLSYSVVVQ